MNTICKVSVILVSYNHEKYLEKAIESVLMQKTNFKYEIIIADDFSTDQTVEIIKRYSKLVKPILNAINLGMMQNYKNAFKYAEGKYIAILEGDDYWNSPLKLQKQYDFLESHHECVLCSHKFTLFDEKSGQFIVNNSHYNQFQKISDLISNNFIGNFSTCMYRKTLINQIPESLYNLNIADWFFNIYLAQYGLIGYLEDALSVYRLHPNGSWSRMSRKAQIKKIISDIDIYNKYLNYKFDKDFQNTKMHNLRLLQKEFNLIQKLKEWFKNLLPYTNISY